MSCWTDWDPLEEVIVGDCYTTVEGVEGKRKDILEQIFEETKEDLNGLVKILESMNVKVHRPEVKQYSHIQMPNFKVNNHIPPMIPRDQFMVYGDTIYQTYTSMPNRYFDSLAYYNIFKELYDQGHNWVSMPPPILEDLSDADKYWWETTSPYNRLSDRILWHTATMLKCGDALVCNARGPGTHVGLDWMERNIPQKIHKKDTFGHIDQGFFLTDDDTVFTCRNMHQKLLDRKNVIDIIPYMTNPPNHKQTMQDVYAEIATLGSEWVEHYFSEWRGYDQDTVFIANVLVVDSKNVIFGQQDDRLFTFLEGLGINCHLAYQRHGIFWEGGIHCMTLDIKRKGNCRTVL
jgi:N-dimethylarginine dimethylaminohydrolase